MTAAAFSSKWKQQHSAAGASSTIQQQVAAATGGGSIHNSRSNMHSSRWGQRWGHVPARTFYTVAGPAFWPKYPLICGQTSQVQDRSSEQVLHCREPTSNKAGSGSKRASGFCIHAETQWWNRRIYLCKFRQAPGSRHQGIDTSAAIAAAQCFSQSKVRDGTWQRLDAVNLTQSDRKFAPSVLTQR